MSHLKQFFYIVPLEKGQEPMTLEEYKEKVKEVNPEKFIPLHDIQKMYNTYYQVCSEHECGNFILDRFLSNDEGLEIAFSQIKEDQPDAILLNTV